MYSSKRLLKHWEKIPPFEEQPWNLCANKAKASIKNYKDHPRKVCIEGKIVYKNNPKFCFNFVSFEQTLGETNKLNSKKACQTTAIPSLSSKETSEAAVDPRHLKVEVAE